MRGKWLQLSSLQPHWIQEGKYYLSKQKVHSRNFQNVQQITEITGYWAIMQSLICNIEGTKFLLRPRITDRSFSEVGNFSKPSCPVLSRFNRSVYLYSDTIYLVSTWGMSMFLPKRQFCQENNKLQVECFWCSTFSQE